MAALIALGTTNLFHGKAIGGGLLAQRLPMHCHGPLHFAGPVLSAPNIPPNSVAKHGSGKKGTEGLGSVGTEATGEPKFSAWAKLFVSLLASRTPTSVIPSRNSASPERYRSVQFPRLL
jgi:hypothetical protein